MRNYCCSERIREKSCSKREITHIRSATTSLASEPEITSPWMEAIMPIIGAVIVLGIAFDASAARQASVLVEISNPQVAGRVLLLHERRELIEVL